MRGNIVIPPLRRGAARFLQAHDDPASSILCGHYLLHEAIRLALRGLPGRLYAQHVE